MIDKLPLNGMEYFMPAEWERHAGTWLQWPQRSLYPGYELKLERLWMMIVEALADNEWVYLIVADEEQRDHVAQLFRYHRIGESRTRFFVIRTNDVWVRDNGPIFVKNDSGEVVITNWGFNGWGGRFEHDLDDLVPEKIAKTEGMQVISPPLVLEGGAVEVNGEGVFMATRTSIIDSHRNPSLPQADIEGVLRKYLGVSTFIWLTGAGRGKCERWGDTTDSHIDLVARFTPQSAILYNWSDDPVQPRYEMNSRHLAELRHQVAELGLDYQLVPLPEPEGGVFQVSSKIDWRSSIYCDAAYTNYYVANGVVLAPVFGNKSDDYALAILREHFPKREVVGLDCVGLTEDGGAIHCVTQQQPVGLSGER